MQDNPYEGFTGELATRKQRNKARKAEKKLHKKQFLSSKRAKYVESLAMADKQPTSPTVVVPPIFLKDGFRFVQPYSRTLRVNVKGRWIGRTLGDVVISEFRTYSREYWMYAIEHGFVQINDKPAPSDTILRDKDVLCHRVHRHEPPVFDSPIKILFEDSSIVAINKPYSIPVHPTGKFWFNTVESMMEFEMGYTDLYLVHRLDRLTSGVLVFAKVKQIAQVWGANIREHIGITKIYLARVEGVFPDEPVEVDQPILVVPKALCKIDASGKPSQTRFERVSTNGKESVVRCYPKTGRTHQIRTHLKWLGFPITNDPLYNDRIRGDRTSAIIEEDGEAVDDTFAEQVAKKAEVREHIPLITPKCASDLHIDSVDAALACPDCKRVYKTPSETEKWLYLHALSYKGIGWEFESDMPVWAQLPSAEISDPV